MTDPRLIYMGTPDFAVPALKTLCEAGMEPVAVYSQPPRPKGRGYDVQKSPVHLYAESQDIPVYHPTNFKTQEDIEIFKSHEADLAIVAAYGLILPTTILSAPKYKCINIHGSLLPRWRGAAPIQRAIEMGDDQTGICIMKMEKGLDTGPVMMRGEVEINGATTAQTLHDELAKMGADLIVPSVKTILKGEAAFEPQDDTHATYAKKLEKQEGLVTFEQSALEIDRKIRAFTPWPGSYFMMPSGKRCKILKASYMSDMSGEQGEILDQNLTIACGAGGALRLELVKPESKSKMSGTDFLNGHNFKVGEKII